MEFKNVGKALGALAVAAVMAWAGYLWAGTQRSAQVEADMRVMRAEFTGRLDRMADELVRTREDVQRLARVIDDMSARQRSGR